MGRGLLAIPPCAEVIERCDALARPLLGESLLEALCSARPWRGVEQIQPAIFTVQVALGAWLAAEGLEAGAVVGHSLGEIAAAHLAGALSLEDAVRVVVTYSREQARTAQPDLGMIVVELAADAVEPLVRARPGIHVAAHNSPESTVVSGEVAALNDLVEALQRRSVLTAPVAVDVAAHGPHVDPILERIRRGLESVQPRSPRVPLASGMRGGWAQAGDFGADYFAANLRAPVRFAQALEVLHAAGGRTFVELGPHPVLARAIHQSVGAMGPHGCSVSALSERGDGDSPVSALTRLEALRMVTAGPRAEGPSVQGPSVAQDAREALVEGALRRVLRLVDGPPPRDTPLISLGLDSLATVELRALLEATVGPLPESLIRRTQTMSELVAALARLEPPSNGSAEPRTTTQRPGSGVFLSRRAPLSAEQARLWFLDRTLARKDTYHVTLPLAVSVPLDGDTLRRAIEHVIVRHEQLRTAFSTQHGEPIQRALPWVEPPLSTVDLRGVSLDERGTTLDTLLRDEASQPFDLARPPLFRVTLVHLGDAGCILHFVFHHLIVDGWSIHLVLRDLDEAYRALASGLEPELAAAPSYIDATTTERGVEHDLRGWWAKELDGLEPLDLGAPPGGPSGAGRVHTVLPIATREAVEGLARRRGCTPFVVLLSALAVLMSRVSGREELVLGTAAARRDVPGRSDVVGFFMNIVPVRCRVQSEITIEQLLADIAAAVSRSIEHAELPYDEILRARPGAQTLLQVCLVLESQRWFERPFASGRMSLVGNSPSGDVEGTSKLGVTFAMVPTDRGYLLSIDHQRSVLPPEAATALARRFESVLAQLARETSRVGELDVVSAEERGRWAALNATQSPLPERSVHALFEATVARDPTSIALVHGPVRLPRGALNERANRLARTLLASGIAPPDPTGSVRIGVGLSSPIDRVVAMLAIAKIGAAYVPLDPDAPRERVARIAADADVAAWIADDALAPEATRGAPRIGPRDRQLDDESPLNLPISVPPDAALYVLYTSGSTGEPKGVEVSHRGLVSLVCWTERTFELGAQDRALAVMSFGFDPACWELWSCLVAGVELHLGDAEVRRSTSRYLRYVREHGITIGVLGANLAHRLVARARGETSSLRLLHTGGEPVRRPPDGLGFDVVNTYGVTEATVVSTYARLRPGDGPAPIGRPIDNTSAHVLDRGGDVALPGTVGELVIGGVGIARGYVRGDGRDRFVEHPRLGRVLFTGDRARLEDDALWFHGRLDDQVKVRGHRIELGELEAVLGAHSGVAECTVIVREDVPGDLRLVAYVVGRAGATGVLEGDALKEHCRRYLPSSMVPSHVVLLPSLPRTLHDKVDRAALPAPSARPLLADSRSPEPLVLECCGLFADNLGLQSVAADDNYFALGGHSLGLLELLDAIERRWTRELTHAAFLDDPTPRGVARALASNTPPPSRLLVTLATGARTPLFCVTAGYGDLVSLRGLAERLGPNRPFHALQAQPGAESLEALAAEYVVAIEEIQPRGPYQLAGYSSGGLVAFEIAQQLLRRGHRVRFLGLLDTPASFGPVQSMLYRHGRVLLDGRLGLVMRMGSRVARVAHFLARDRGLHAYLTLLAAYRPVPLPIRVTLIVPELSHHRWSLVRRRWERLAAGGLDVARVSGDHESFVRAPHVEMLATALRARLDDQEGA